VSYKTCITTSVMNANNTGRMAAFSESLTRSSTSESVTASSFVPTRPMKRKLRRTLAAVTPMASIVVIEVMDDTDTELNITGDYGYVGQKSTDWITGLYPGFLE